MTLDEIKAVLRSDYRELIAYRTVFQGLIHTYPEDGIQKAVQGVASSAATQSEAAQKVESLLERILSLAAQQTPGKSGIH